MTQGYSLKELVNAMKGQNINTFIDRQNVQFTERFGIEFEKSVSVILEFENSYDAQDFYHEVKFNRDYAFEYTVKSLPNDSSKLCVSGAPTLYDYFGSREPNLLTVSRDLGISFNIEFVQDYSGTRFTGSVNRGELLSRQCIIEMSTTIPELALGGLVQIGTTDQDFEDLLTRIYVADEMVIL